ncbi:MAG: hypothetical protein JO299_06175 [Gammaproteobacteria bacterium]|nr:hypothetical protein [Gammaproteobacteria bacterium]
MSYVPALGTLAFWVGMTLAGRSYPSEYDWRYVTISSLVYAERNPSGFAWARAGILLCGMAGLYWIARLTRAWKRLCIAERPSGSSALAFGFLCMTLCALVPERRFPFARAHDLLALAAFVGICAGMALVSFTLTRQSARARELPSGPWYAWPLAALAVFPIVAAGGAQLYLSHSLPGLPWVSLAWRERGIPAYLSFAFWEWVACAVFSLYLLLLSLRVEFPSGP